MINWDFRDTILYNEEVITQDSRKFEILVFTYLKECYPIENWKLTKSTRDGNRDMESVCEFSGTTMWAEVKFTTHTGKNISSRKYDSTLVSSMFEKNLIKIFFISNTSMGSQLINRIKKFYYLSTVNKIAFIDGFALAYWLRKHPNVERYFFKTPINIIVPKHAFVRLNCVRIYCISDSYTIDSILEEQVVYPLYLTKNYILEGEFTAYGFDASPLLLYCNDKLLYKDFIPPEITTFSLNINNLGETFNVNEEYLLHFYYLLDNKKIECGNYKLRFALTGRLYRNQIENYTLIHNGFKATYKKIYNIYGPQATGKSWLLNNLKNDYLKKVKDNQKIIYINFTGQSSDIAYICRLVFTLVFNFYNMSISASTLIEYCKKNNVINSFFNYENIVRLIQSLQDDDYPTTQKILYGSLFSQSTKIFDTWNGFATERFYFIDNVQLLSSTNFLIFEVILRAFNPLKDVLFVLTGREKICYPNVENIYLGYIENDEILDSINENLSFSINKLNEIVPTKHYLKYPGLLHSFIHQVTRFKSLIEIKQYYINDFINNALHYLKGDFTFDNIILLLICVVKAGIPIEILSKIDFDKIKELINNEYIVQKEGVVYPNFERWNKTIPQGVMKKYKTSVISYLESFMELDSAHQELYQCSLMEHYPEYYNKYFNSIYERIGNLFEKNKYGKVIFLCETVLNKSSFYIGNNQKIKYVKYYLAFSYMHCDVSKKAKKYFCEITESYETKLKDALYFDAEAEVIDAKYWEFQNYKNLLISINKFRKNWKSAEHKIHNLKIRPYLTATNRMMVTYLALDNIKLAKKWLSKNVKLAIRYKAYEHIGYTYMDYAKGIYHFDLSLALKYLEYADLYFQIPSENRRHLDCQCEIQYIKLLLGRGSVEQLLFAQQALFENQYWIQYYKCHLKLSVYYILKGKRKEALQHLLEAETPAIMKNDERIKYLCSMIGSFLYKEPIIYENVTLVGTSYQKIIRNMHLHYKKSNAVLYNINTISSLYNLDPRVW